MSIDAVELLKQLVAIPSVNPMDGEVEGAFLGEARLTDFLEKSFMQIGLSVFRQPVLPDRENLIARLDGVDSDRLLLLDAHQDTVSVEGMTVQPFMLLEREGRLFGRGACDVKGGMAAIIAAVSRLANHRPRPTIVVACTVNEEHGFSGASRLVQLWNDDGGGEIIPRRPDAALVVEPTGLDVVVAHKGVIRWRCHTRGRAGHSSRPTAGDNAIYRMARVVSAIEQFAGELETDGPAHPLCGRRTLSVGTIHGGTSVNTVPDRCTIEIDCRPPPGDSPEDARQELIDRLSQPAATTFPLAHDMAFISGPPLSDDNNRQLADRLLQSVGEIASGAKSPCWVGQANRCPTNCGKNDGGAALRLTHPTFRNKSEIVGECGRQGVPYATNAAFYAEAGVPSVVFGPGSIEQAHTADEWISLDQLHQSTEIIERFCRSFS